MADIDNTVRMQSSEQITLWCGKFVDGNYTLGISVEMRFHYLPDLGVGIVFHKWNVADRPRARDGGTDEQKATRAFAGKLVDDKPKRILLGNLMPSFSDGFVVALDQLRKEVHEVHAAMVGAYGDKVSDALMDSP